MGLLFENLIRRFNELANETAGDHFTPRDVIGLMVNLLFIHDDDLLARPGTVRKLLDPTCGTGGMLAESQRYLHEHHAEAQLWVFGQDYNKRAFAVAASDLLIKGHENSEVRFGDSLTDDQFSADKFDYFLANPPFGVDWKKQSKEIEAEHDKLGSASTSSPVFAPCSASSLPHSLGCVSRMKSNATSGKIARSLSKPALSTATYPLASTSSSMADSKAASSVGAPSQGPPRRLLGPLQCVPDNR